MASTPSAPVLHAPYADAPSRDATRTDWRHALPESRRRHLRLWLWSVAAMTFLTLVVGGITRLTQSGLSIVDWSPFMGVVPPLTEAGWQEAFQAYRAYPEYLELRRGMTLDEFRFIYFWEYLHRMVARTIGLVFLLPFLFFWVRGYLSRPLLLRALGLFALGGAQGAMGWFMVRSGLVDLPRVSHYRLAAHLSLAFVIFGAAVWLARNLALAPDRTRVTAERHRLLRLGLGWVGALLAVQIIWGAFVAGLRAGFMYNTFPLMAGGLVPPDLLDLDPLLLNPVENPSAVQWMHRLLGTLLLGASGVLWLRVRRQGEADPDPRTVRLNHALFGGIAAQYLLGVVTLLLVVPVWLGVAHQAVAMVLAGIWVVWAHHVRHMAVAEP